MSNPSASIVARTFPPAKLNLFLELLDRREDGYHEIDTVMVPIDWRDELRIRATVEPGIRLRVDWSPSLDEVARQLQIDPDGETAEKLLHLPADESNLVYHALDRFQRSFAIGGGFEVQLSKQIPAGAGMGGASSDAASALRSAAVLHQISLTDPRLRELAAEVGSDVPFFMGIDGLEPISAARGTGRGEHLKRIHVAAPLSAVVVYPAVSLSTAEVYSFAQAPSSPLVPDRLIEQLGEGVADAEAIELANRLSEPAKNLATQISEVLQSLASGGPVPCQMTGSGSACFALTSSLKQAEQLASQVRSQMQAGAFVRSVCTVTAPAAIEMIPFGSS